MDQTRTKFLMESECDSSTKPPSKESCNRKGCEWRIGSWTDCSHTCGLGTQRRLVRCTRPVCHTERPSDIQTCEISECTKLNDPINQVNPINDANSADKNNNNNLVQPDLNNLVLLNKNDNSVVSISGVSQNEKKIISPEVKCLQDSSFECKDSTVHQCSMHQYWRICCKTCEKLNQAAFNHEYQIYSEYLNPDSLSLEDQDLLDQSVSDHFDASDDIGDGSDADYYDLYRMF